MEEGVDIGASEDWFGVIWTDDFHSYPQTDNHVFQGIALYCKEILKAPFLYMTAQSVPTRPTWFEEINAAYVEAIKKRKPFMGDLIRDDGLRLNCMSPVGVYPPNISSFAGEIMIAQHEHWSVEGGAQIGNWFQKTELIHHLRDGDINSHAALVSPDRDGSFFERIYGHAPITIATPVPDIFEPETKGGRSDKLDLTTIKPWDDNKQSIAVIKTLCKELRSYCDGNTHTGIVRKELAALKIVEPIQVFRKNKFTRRKRKKPVLSEAVRQGMRDRLAFAREVYAAKKAKAISQGKT
jgi:hypothetical protein